MKLPAPTTVAKAGETKAGEKDGEAKQAKPAVAPGKDQPSQNSKGEEEGIPKNSATPHPPSVDNSGDPSLEQDVQLQKAVEMLKTWKIFKELPRAS